MTTTQIRGIEVNGAKIENAQQFARQFSHAPDWYAGINRVACPSGSAPGEGKFLVQRADFEANWPETAVFDIVFQRHDGTSLVTTTLKNYVTLSAHAALRIKDGGPMVVKVVDVRYLLARKHINKTFNVSDDSNDWLAVLASLANDVPLAYGDALAFETVPTYTPSNLRYEGWSIIDAIADVAHRTSHTLIYNPITGKLQLKNMAGSQPIIANALHRNWEVPETTFASAIGVVAVNVDIADSELSEIVERTQGAAINTATAWASRKKTGTNQTAVDAEADALADTWFDWSDRKAARRVREFFGSLPIESGSQVGVVTWHVADNDLFTIVDEDAPPEPTTKRQPFRSSSKTMTNGSFNCCTCENSELHFSIAGTGITGEHVLNDMWPVKSVGGLLQKIILTSDDNPAVTRKIELPLIDCADIDCQVQDMTGEFVGTREIESIIFGNSKTCATFCDPLPAITYLEETFAVLPTVPWSTSLANSSVASNVMTMTAQDSIGADFGPSIASQVFHTKILFRVIPNVSLATAIWIAIEGRLFSFADDGTWSSDGFTGIGTAGATIEFLIADNVVTVDGTAAGVIAPGSISGCGAEVSFVLRTTDISAFNPTVGTDVGEIDVLEIGYR